MKTLFPIQVRTLTGLEDILAEELKALGAREIRTSNRVVFCEGDQEVLYRANIHCRTAIRVLRPLVSFPAPDEKSLYEGLQKVRWANWLRSGGTIAVDASVYSSFTTHSLFVAQLSKDAVVDQLRKQWGTRPSVDLRAADLRIVVALFEDEAQVSLDSSGDSLHKRGYRTQSVEAPLSETLAAGIIRISGWKPEQPLLNPMCGSGTLAIEAALMAKNIPPGLIRNHFGFQNWPDYQEKLYRKIIEEAKSNVIRSPSVTIIASDWDPSAVEATKENARRAGVAELISVKQGDFFESDNADGLKAVMVMNPPYDERLQVDNVAELTQNLGDHLKQKFGGCTAYLLMGNLEVVKYVGLRPSKKTVLFNGGLECRLLKYELRSPKQESSQGPIWRSGEAPSYPLWDQRAEMFRNRLRKNQKQLDQWLKRQKISCYRVYDNDIPELPFQVERFGEHLQIWERQRNYEHKPTEHSHYQTLMSQTAAEALGVSIDNVNLKRRKRQKDGFQYSGSRSESEFIEVTENGLSFLVNLSDYLDVGLFLDHRNTRAMVKEQAAGKDVLNLFAYTGSFSVYAASGGARTTTTVDTSKTYLNWALENLKLNGLASHHHSIVRSDTIEYLQQTSKQFDICIVDPPTRSVNRSSGRVFDVQQDHADLLALVREVMRPGGLVYFSTNYRTFELDAASVRSVYPGGVEEITQVTVPRDCQRFFSHRAWKLSV